MLITREEDAFDGIAVVMRDGSVHVWHPVLFLDQEDIKPYGVKMMENTVHIVADEVGEALVSSDAWRIALDTIMERFGGKR